jgi:hypothetical protein
MKSRIASALLVISFSVPVLGSAGRPIIRPGFEVKRTGTLLLFPDYTVSLESHRQTGWKYAAHFRSGQRKEIVEQ